MLKASRKVCIAPMIDCTDRHFRYFLRLISKHVWLYTEMITTFAILHGDRDKLLKYDSSEHPLALQLGGSCPEDLASCAQIAADYGYDEVNLNVGCPSDRVQAGRFGACLMAEPELVAEAVLKMRQQVNIPITVKTRIGIDQQDSYEFLNNFINTVKAAGCQTFIIHARKAWLKGLSPKQNREVPPLCYEAVYKIKQEHPELEIIINGGIINAIDGLKQHAICDGVMLGRAAYNDPYSLVNIDRELFHDSSQISKRHEIMLKFATYVETQLSVGTRLNGIMRHILGLAHGVPGAKQWRRYLSENIHNSNADIKIYQTACRLMQELA